MGVAHRTPNLNLLLAAITLAITFAIEFLKLWHAQTLEALRAARLSGFLLGHAFYWHDFASYTAGTLLESFSTGL